ncbi:MAG: Holliday junction branch migration protein RuvA [Burkholderiaceae bacterium]|nr:Holliday junction branch migration protein RuvA [Burkholderiaceae bacterium]
MIGRLSGTLLEKHPPTVLVDVGGVGYEVDVPMSTFYDLPATGARVTLLVQPVVREDAHLLYGFLRADERDAFRQLIRISGIGARTALAVLSGLSVAELAQAVARQDAGRLQKVPGIGRKTAERLVLELEGKLAQALGDGARAAPAEAATDVLNALLALGYSERESSAAVRQLPAGIAVSDGIKQSLKLLAKT